MKELRRLVAGGYRDAKQLEKDSDLNPLRGRADFSDLLRGLKKP